MYCSIISRFFTNNQAVKLKMRRTALIEDFKIRLGHERADDSIASTNFRKSYSLMNY